ncbi:MAG: TRAP transporter substrate-binding protein [Deltaproteobacteria bacterium]|nr:MAG: TRAP transporter substrate-binding protein [Deltaproteobacteria bacterium]
MPRPIGGLKALALLLLVLLAGGETRAERVKLKAQAGFKLTMPVIGEGIAHFRDTIEASGGDDLRFRIYDADKLVPTLQIFDAVSAGKIDAGFTWPGYWMGKLPATTVFAAVPFGPEPDEFLAWLHQGGGLGLWRKLYAPHDAVPIPCGVLPPEASGWFAKPIERADDLAGLKVRYAGLGGKVLEKLGASITMLAAGDIFLSLERGVIDATEYSMPSTDRPLGFYKIAKHYYFPGWHQPASIMELIVNKQTWEAMSPGQRRRIETACDSTTLFQLTRGIATQPEALAFYRNNGVTLHRWPPQLLERFRALAEEVMAEASAADPAFAEAWRSLESFRARHAEWAGMAYAR